MPPLVLASRSPRRAALLRDAGFEFEQVTSSTPEPALPQRSENVADVALTLARGKLANFSSDASLRAAVVIAADTIVVAPQGLLLGQPNDAQEAREMLQLLFGAPHRVVTGVCLACSNEVQIALTDEAEVRIESPGDRELESYLQSQEWRGKAGGYNLAELESRWRIRIAPGSDPSTVVGLPMRKLVPSLRRLGVRPVRQVMDTNVGPLEA